MLRDAAALDELRIGEMKGVLIEGRPVLLVRLDDGVRAYADRCSHLGVRLSQGKLEGTRITCYAHEWLYDATTGCGINPASCSLTAFPAEVRAGRIYVDPECRSGAASAGFAQRAEGERRRSGERAKPGEGDR